MSARRGWCPTVFAPMPSGDGLLLRVRPPDAVLSPPMLRAIADLAARCGNGRIELTARANLQLRGFDAAGAAHAAQHLVACGAAAADPLAERRRALIVSPLSGDDPGVHGDPPATARALLAALAQGGLPDPLPDKFCIAVDGGGVLPLPPAVGVLRVRLSPRGCTVRVGDAAPQRCPPAGLAAAARRMLDEAGWRGGRAAAIAGAAAGRVAGFLPYPGTARGAFALAPPFGELSAPMLLAATDLAALHGDGLVRIDPRRCLLLGGVAAAGAAALAGAAGLAGFIVDPADPRLGIVACPGAPACASGAAPARADAAALARLAGPWRGLVHVSGCDKGCAHPGPAAFTLVGRAGGYDLVRHGRAGDPPLRAGLDLAGCARAMDEAL